MTADPSTIVEAGYDAVADRYLAWAARVDGDPRLDLLADLMGRLPDGVRVLELGCGAGEPCTRLLAERFAVTGVDLSAEQLRRAREHVPTAEFRKADMATVRFENASFDAVTAFYSIIHVPRRRHGALFARIASWLRPGGLLLASLGAGSSDDSVEEGWLGVPMFFSTHDAVTNRRLLSAAGFALLIDEVVTIREPEGDATFHWVLAEVSEG
jgi:SAM-dependent methyltransferase